MTIKLLSLMALLSLVGCSSDSASRYPQDKFLTLGGDTVTLTFFKHASFSIACNDKYIYVDPVMKYADYGSLPKADLILITHSHEDHFDNAAIDSLSDDQTSIICDVISAKNFKRNYCAIIPGSSAFPREYVKIDALPAYNTTAGHTQFHPQDRLDCSYLLTIDGTRIYIAGDGENTPEMESLSEIDIALLPVNQPYTMTVDQAIHAVKAIKPKVFYPIHTGETDVETDLDRLESELEGVTDVRIRPME
ncbi:MAG: MBL fold metallo-hydrolase [Alistipes sp.]